MLSYQPPTVSRTQAAAHLDVSASTVDRWIAEGRLPATKDQHGRVVILVEDVERLRVRNDQERVQQSAQQAREAEASRLQREGAVKESYELNKARERANTATRTVWSHKGAREQLEREREQLAKEAATPTTDASKILARKKREAEIAQLLEVERMALEAAHEAEAQATKELEAALVIGRRHARVEAAARAEIERETVAVLASVRQLAANIAAGTRAAGDRDPQIWKAFNMLTARVVGVLNEGAVPAPSPAFSAVIERAQAEPVSSTTEPKRAPRA